MFDQDFLVAWFFIMLALTLFWSTVWYLGWLEEAVGLIVNGFCKEVLQQLPMEFAVEAQKLVGISLEGSVG